MTERYLGFIFLLSALFDLVSDCDLIYLTYQFIGKITAFFVSLRSIWSLMLFVWLCYLVLKRKDPVSPNAQFGNNGNQSFWNGVKFYHKCAKYWLYYGYMMILFILVIISDSEYRNLLNVEFLSGITLVLFVFTFIIFIRSAFMFYIESRFDEFPNIELERSPCPLNTMVPDVPTDFTRIPYVVMASAFFEFISDGALAYGALYVIGFVTGFSIALKAIFSSILFVSLCYTFPQREEFWKLADFYRQISTYCLGYSFAITDAAVVIIFDSGYTKSPKLLSDKSMNSVVIFVLISMIILVIRSLFLIIFKSYIRRQVRETQLPNVQYQVQNDRAHILSQM